MNNLWTPAPIGRDIQNISYKEMKVLEDLHPIAQRLGLVLVCGACDSAFTGENSGHERTPAIACRCREIRTERLSS